MDLDKLLPDKQIKHLIGVYFILSFVGCIMVFYRIFLTVEIGYLYLIWNLFLAWIPFVVSVLIFFLMKNDSRKKLKRSLIVPLGFVWLFFYPNAPYIITDYIHIRGIPFYLFQKGRFSGFNPDFIVWFDFVMNSLFIFTGFLLGFVSLNLIHRIVIIRYGRLAGWGFVGVILALSSFGIYLGRFIRWNTWDIVSQPLALFKSVINSIHIEALSFTLLFSFFLILIYVALSQLTSLGRKGG